MEIDFPQLRNDIDLAFSRGDIASMHQIKESLDRGYGEIRPNELQGYFDFRWHAYLQMASHYFNHADLTEFLEITSSLCSEYEELKQRDLFSRNCLDPSNAKLSIVFLQATLAAYLPASQARKIVCGSKLFTQWKSSLNSLKQSDCNEELEYAARGLENIALQIAKVLSRQKKMAVLVELTSLLNKYLKSEFYIGARYRNVAESEAKSYTFWDWELYKHVVNEGIDLKTVDWIVSMRTTALINERGSTFNPMQYLDSLEPEKSMLLELSKTL